MNRLRSLLHVEPGEELPVLLLFLYLASALTSYLIVKAARDALFLHRFSAMSLPYVYIGAAILIGLAIPLYLRISSRLGLTALITGSLVFFIANVLMLWWAARVSWSPLAAVFYVWSSIFGVTVPTQVWTVANRVLDVRQAKRLFPLISSGGILGSAAGGLIAAAAVKRIGTYHLLLTLIPLLVLCICLARLLLRRHAFSQSGLQPRVRFPEKKVAVESPWKPLVQSRYLRMIAVMLALSAVVTLVVDFQFKLIIQQSGHSRDQLTAFFGEFYACLNFLALVLQLSAGSRLAERFGVRMTLFILPTALVTGTLLLLVFPMRLWTALFIKGSDQTLRYSIDKSTVELLYLPVPQKLKADAKAVIDMMVQRLADGIGGVLLVVITNQHLLHLGLTGVGVFNLVLLSVWLWVAFFTRKEYVAAVKASISERSVLPRSALRLVFDDPGSIATVRSMLESDDEEVVLYAMDLVRSLGQRIPAEFASHPSPRIRLKAMELASISAPQPVDRARKGISSVIRTDGPGGPNLGVGIQPTAILQEYLHASDVRVRLSALVCLARQGMATETLQKHLHAVTAELKTSENWNDFFQALSEIRHPAMVELHKCMLDHPVAAVRRQAVLSAGRAGQRELVPVLVRLLGDSEVAGEARRALRDFGPRVLGTLADVMKDPSENVEVRRNIPRVLAYVPHQATVEILLEGLFDYDAVVADRSLHALSKLRLVDSTLRFDPEKIRTRIRDEGEKALWYRRALACLYPPEGQSADLLARLLSERTEQAEDHVFRLLALILPPATLHVSFLVLRRDDRLKKANVAEYLDNVLPPNLKKWVLPLIEPKADVFGGKQDRGEVLEALLKSPEILLRECMADAIARNGWAESVARGPTIGRAKEEFGYG